MKETSSTVGSSSRRSAKGTVRVPLGEALPWLRQLEELGANEAHLRSLLRDWLTGVPQVGGHERASLRRPSAVNAVLPSVREHLDGLLTGIQRDVAADGSCRHLLRLRSGRTVESVDLPRAGVCVSTQVGCAVGCTFCATGASGLLQQLGADEILAQVVRARRERGIRRVVFMGMGEPAHNLENVLRAVELLGLHGDLAHDDLVFSTVGDPAVIARLESAVVRPALALSLHTLDPELRTRLLPRAPEVDPSRLLVRALRYADGTGRALQLQWTLLRGINDDLDTARVMGRRLAGRRAVVNYIPYNEAEGSGFARPTRERCVELVRAVRAEGAIATLRFSAGQEVGGGCGQLRVRSTAAGPRP